jgi:hypothetical protein
MSGLLICKKHALDKSYKDPQDTHYVLYSICQALILRFTDTDKIFVWSSAIQLMYIWITVSSVYEMHNFNDTQ